MTILIHSTYGLLPLELKSSNTLLSALHHPKQFCKNTPDKSLILSDYNSLSGAIEFTKACKDNDIKPIIGVKFLDSNKKSIHLIARNKDGYTELLNLISRSNDKDRYKNRPVLELGDIPKTENLISLIGGMYADISEENVQKQKEKFKYIFGLITKNEVNDQDYVDQLSSLCIPLVRINDCHYLKKEELEDYKILLCSALRCKLKSLDKILNDAHHDFLPALSSYYEDLGDDCSEMLGLIEDYQIYSKPEPPKYVWTDGLTEEEYLLKLCREGYRRRKLDSWDEEVYGARVKEELDVIQKYKLSGYFLIVRDYIKWAKERMLVGPARGSSLGSLVCYLIEITEVDPIPYDLLFERFINAGRFADGNIEYPDIDTDFPPSHRESIVEYIREKYGEEYVSQIATYGRMMGSSILKEVLSAHDVSSFEQINHITKYLPQEAEIESELVALEESGKQYSILQWVLENKPELVRDYCEYSDNKYSGYMASYFEQAIRLEGTFKSQGKHAAGIIIAPDKLGKICPMLHDKSSKYKVAGLDLNSIKKVAIKFDILGVNALSKVENIFRKVTNNGTRFEEAIRQQN